MELELVERMSLNNSDDQQEVMAAISMLSARCSDRIGFEMATRGRMIWITSGPTYAIQGNAVECKCRLSDGPPTRSVVVDGAVATLADLMTGVPAGV